MKKSNILMTGAAALVGLMAVVGIGLYTFAQTDTTTATPTPGFLRAERWQNLTDEQKAAREAQKAEWEAQREANQQKIEEAMYQGYDAWAAAIKEVQGENAPILSQITADNFDRYVEGHEYMEKGRAIFEELGIQKGFGFGGPGGKMGRGGGCHGPRGDFGENNTTAGGASDTLTQ